MGARCWLKYFAMVPVFVLAVETLGYADIVNVSYDNSVGIINNATSVNGLPQTATVETSGPLPFPFSSDKSIGDNGGFNPNLVASYYLTSSNLQFSAAQSANSTTFDWNYSEQAIDGAHSIGYAYYGAENRLSTSFSVTGNPATYTITDNSSLNLTNLALELWDYNVQTHLFTIQYLDLYGVGTTTNLSHTFTGTLLPGNNYSLVAAAGLESDVGVNVVSAGDISLSINADAPQSVPEPSTLLLLMTGGFGAVMLRRPSMRKNI